MTIYVERFIRTDLDELWRRTQDPAEHERWDLRFTRISYLERPHPDEPQRFEYATRVLPGVVIRGVGETAGERRRPDGSATSALRFWAEDPRSLVRDGSGYWRYTPDGDGVRFITGYDYRTRFGTLGRVVDRMLFRPVMGWATAWSFDRLALWLEEDVPPEGAVRRAISAALRLGPRTGAPTARRCLRAAP